MLLQKGEKVSLLTVGEKKHLREGLWIFAWCKIRTTKGSTLVDTAFMSIATCAPETQIQNQTQHPTGSQVSLLDVRGRWTDNRFLCIDEETGGKQVRWVVFVYLTLTRVTWQEGDFAWWLAAFRLACGHDQEVSSQLIIDVGVPSHLWTVRSRQGGLSYIRKVADPAAGEMDQQATFLYVPLRSLVPTSRFLFERLPWLPSIMDYHL